MVLTSKRLAGWSLPVLASLLLAGCGGGGSGGDDGAFAATGATPALAKEGEAPSAPASPSLASGGAAGAWQCIDNLASVSGTRYVMRYRITGGATFNSSEFNTETEVVGTEVFENVKATKLLSIFREGTFSAESVTYLSIEGLTSLFHGGTTALGQSANTKPVKTAHVPAAAFRYDLGAGENFTQTYDATSSDDTEITKVTRTVTFVGIEPVTVPAGTFEACRFTIDDIVTINGELLATHRTTNWLAVHSGISLRSESRSRTSSQTTTVVELIEGRINGEVVIPGH